MTSAQNARLPPLQLFSLNGKTVIATGGCPALPKSCKYDVDFYGTATNGLSPEMCRTMAEAGANIVAILAPWDPEDFDLKNAINAVGREMMTFKCNTGDSAALRECFQAIWEAGVVPDILLNCSTLNRRGSISQITDETIDLIFAVNLKGAFVAAQEFGLQLIKLGRRGKIINFASTNAHLAMTNVSPYAAAKAGVVQMTKAFSNEWASHGIQVNCISPGYTKTPMTASLTSQYPGMDAYITERTPSGRWGTPEDYRGVVLFLSSAASDFVSGISVAVDGGMLAR